MREGEYPNTHRHTHSSTLLIVAVVLLLVVLAVVAVSPYLSGPTTSPPNCLRIPPVSTDTTKVFNLGTMPKKFTVNKYTFDVLYNGTGYSWFDSNGTAHRTSAFLLVLQISNGTANERVMIGWAPPYPVGIPYPSSYKAFNGKLAINWIDVCGVQLYMEVTVPNVTTTTTATTSVSYTAMVSTITTVNGKPVVIQLVDFSKLTPISSNNTSLSQGDILGLYRDFLRNTSCSGKWTFLNPVAATPSIKIGGAMLDKNSNQSLPQSILPLDGCSNIVFAYYENVSTSAGANQGRYVIAGGEYLTLSAPIVYGDGTVYFEVEHLVGPLYASGGWVNMTKTTTGSWVIRSQGGKWIA